MKDKYIDFICDCGSKECGKLRIITHYLPKNSPRILEIGLMFGREKIPKKCVCIRDKDIDRLIKLITSK